MTPDLQEVLTAALAVAQERVDSAQERLAAARLDRARIVARLADDVGMSHTEISQMLPGVSRQRAGQIAKQGRLAPPDSEPLTTAGRAD